MTDIVETENILVVAKYSGRESGEQWVWLVVLGTSCILIVCMYVLVVILYYSFARCYH